MVWLIVEIGYHSNIIINKTYYVYPFSLSNKHCNSVKKFCFKGSDETRSSFTSCNGNGSSIKSSLSDTISSKSIEFSRFS